MRGLLPPLLVLLLACGVAPPPLAPSMVAANNAEPEPGTQPAPLAVEKYQLPPSNRAVPSWWRPPVDTVVGPSELDGTVAFVTVGRRIAIFRWFGGYLVADAERGVLGTFPQPSGTQWVGVDERDRVLVADADGTLHRADSWREAQSPSGFVTLATVAGAREWDLSKGVIAAATDKGVHVSYDGGATFVPAPVWNGSTLDLRVMTRSDRTVVAQARLAGGGFITRSLPRRAKAWRPGPNNLAALTRRGDWIGESSRCGQVLARNGKRWVTAPARRRGKWAAMMSLSSSSPLNLARQLERLSVPRAPAKAQACADGGGGVSGSGTGGGGRAEPLRGTTGAIPRSTAQWHALWSDGLCHPDPKSQGFCAENKAPLRSPHVATWDERERTLAISELPSACIAPTTLRTVAGVGVLRCVAADTLSVWTVGDDHAWHLEAQVPVPGTSVGPDHTTVASDGTMLMHGSCWVQGACEPSLLRAPSELGGRWTVLDDPQALTYRVLPGGRALRVSGSHDRGYTLTVIDATGAESSVVKDLGAGPLMLAELKVANGAEIALRWQEGVWVDLAADGSLVPRVPSSAEPGHVAWSFNGSRPLVTGAGDFDGDGVSDLVFARRDKDNNPYLTVVSGRRDWSAFDVTSLDERTLRITLDVPGHSVGMLVGVGDFNGDGRGDIGLLRDTFAGGGLSAEAYIIFGTKGLTEIRASALRKGKGGVLISGFPVGSPYSRWLGALGDVNGDGLADLALGFRLEHDNAGSLFVIHGRKSSAWVHLKDISRGSGGFELRGGPRQSFGARTAALGDFDGDGEQDFAVLASADGQATERARIFVVRGGKARPQTSMEINARVQAGDAYAIRPGAVGKISGISAAGDVNADGVSDLLVWQPYANTVDSAKHAEPEAGRVLVLFGARRVPQALMPVLEGQGGFRIDGAFAFDHAGLGARGVGDLDGDGRDDLVIGAPSMTRAGTESGRAYVVHGRLETTPVALVGLPAAAVMQARPRELRLGSSISAVGDIDGDGHPDFVVTSEGHVDEYKHSRVHIVLGTGSAR